VPVAGEVDTADAGWDFESAVTGEAVGADGKSVRLHVEMPPVAHRDDHWRGGKNNCPADRKIAEIVITPVQWVPPVPPVPLARWVTETESIRRK